MSEDWPPKPPPADSEEPRRAPRRSPPPAGHDEDTLPERPAVAGGRAGGGARVGGARVGGPRDAGPDGDGPGDDRGDDAGPSRNVRALGAAIVVVVVFIVIAALVGGTRPPGNATFPPVGAMVGPAGNVTAVTRGEVIRALSAQGLQAEDTTRPYRPAEAPAFAAAPRILLRAILPDDPDHGLIVIYEFSSPAAATAAAQEEATYIASGIGQVQFPNDSEFVIRVVGSTAVFFTWSPPSSTDGRTSLIPAALENVGTAVPVPN